MTENLDGAYANAFLAVGTKKDRNAYTYTANQVLLTQMDLVNLYQFDGFARKVIDKPAEEMVRAGYCLENVKNEDKLQAALEDINMLPLLCDALRWSRLFGGSLIVMLINDGRLLKDPLNDAAIKGIDQLRVYDRWQVSRNKIYSDPADRRFGKTEQYMVSPNQGGPYLVHESRCIFVDGTAVPDIIRIANDGWGNSKLQQCYDQLVKFGMSQVWANGLLERAQQGIHGIPNLTDLLRQPGGKQLIQDRVNIVDMSRSVNNTIVIDALETYELKSTSLAGVSDLIDRLGLALSAVADMPESILFGRQQGGLNSTGESDLENWHAQIGQLQKDKLLPIIDRIVTLQMTATGTYTPDYLVKFNPLSVPSGKELSETRYKNAQTAEIYHNMQALDASEVRKTLPSEGYEIDNVDLMPEGPDDKEEDI